MTMRVEIRLLGGFEVAVAGRCVSAQQWRRRQAAALVKLLALSDGHRLMRDQVIDALWPALSIEVAAPRLHKAAHYARTVLGARDGVVLSGEAVSLFPLADVVVDVELFGTAAAAARSNNLAASAAADLYRGDLLPDDRYEPWAEDPRERLRLRYLDLLRVLGRWDEVLAADPGDEQAHLQVVREQIDRADRRGALLQLDRMEAVLQRELGVEPSKAAMALRAEALALPVAGRHPRAAQTLFRLPPTQTVGRNRDAAGVAQMLARSGVLTLLGPDGMGKARSALEVALRCPETSTVDPCFVDLTSTADTRHRPALIVRERGMQPGAAANVEHVLAEVLGGSRLLIVSDNFEHLVGSAVVVSRMTQHRPSIPARNSRHRRAIAVHTAGGVRHGRLAGRRRARVRGAVRRSGRRAQPPGGPALGAALDRVTR